MKVKSERIIKSGNQFNPFVKPAEYKKIKHANFETVDKTVSLIKQTVIENAYQTKDLSQILKGNNIYESCQNIYNFIVEHIQYTDDGQNEVVRTPARVWADRAGDCDCMTVFSSSILYNLNIKHVYRLTGYEKTKKNFWGNKVNYCDDYQHIYVIAYDEKNKPIIIDPVIDEFNTEHPYCKKTDMALIQLKGINGEETLGGLSEGLGELGSLEKIGDFFKAGGITGEGLKELEAQVTHKSP